MKIGLCNVNGVASVTRKLDLLEHNVREHKISIICLCETHLSPRHSLKLGDGASYFDVFRKDRNAIGGGVAILSKQTHGAVEVKLPRLLNGTEAVAVEVALPGGETLCIVCVYHPTGARDMDYGLLRYLETEYDHLVVCGDFNAKHTDWGVNETSNKNGVSLKAFLEHDSLLELEHCGEATYVGPFYTRHVISTLDMFLLSPSMRNSNPQNRVLGDVGSDHLLVELSLQIADTDQNAPQPPSEKFSFQDAQWVEYSDRLGRDLGDLVLAAPLNTPADLDSAAELVERCILDAANQHIPKRTLRPGSKPGLPRHVVTLIKTRSRVLRRIARGETGLKPTRNRLTRQIEEEITAFRNRGWERYADNIDEKNPWPTFGRVDKGMQNIPRRSTVLQVNGNTLRTAEEQSEVFAETLQMSYRPQESPHFPTAHIDDVTNTVLQNPNVFRHKQRAGNPEVNDLMRPIEAAEVHNALKTVANRSPGPDGVYNIMLSKGPFLLREILGRIFSLCLILGYMPSRWKRAETVMIPKPEKDRTKPDSYRPISLLPVLGKLLEKIVAARLTIHLGQIGALNRYQSGFRQKRECNDHTLRLTQAVSLAFNKKQKVYAVFLDVAKAFDSVWHDGLRIKLCDRRFGLPESMVRFLSDYLCERRYRVRCKTATSRWLPIHAGVPQGGSLSPLLFLLYVNDLPLQEDRHTVPSQFADDLALWSTSGSSNVAHDRLQTKLDAVVDWCDKWRMNLNAGKSQSIVFEKHRCPSRVTEHLTIHGDEVPIVDQVRFLGITFDPGIRFTPHIDNLVARSKRKFQVLKSLCGWEYGPTPECAIRMFVAYVRSVLEYGAPAWHTNLNASNHQKLDRIQNWGCRIALRFPRWSPREQLRRVSGLEPINDRLTEAGRRYIQRSWDNPLIQELVQVATQIVPNDQWVPTPVERHIA